ncbi:hypothetical protein JXA02_12510 [candidate division KSB1 bacterium]|nr:hypothetical protein [candidate division KSB1 bacterium]
MMLCVGFYYSSLQKVARITELKQELLHFYGVDARDDPGRLFTWRHFIADLHHWTRYFSNNNLLDAMYSSVVIL